MVEENRDKIEIIRENISLWGFSVGNEDKSRYNYLHGDIPCKICGYRLDSRYCDIISNLQDSGLLPENYELLCCSCFTITKYKENTRCPECEAVINADLVNGRVHIFCEENCGFEEFFDLTPEDKKYLDEYVRSMSILRREVVRDIHTGANRPYIEWLLNK